MVDTGERGEARLGIEWELVQGARWRWDGVEGSRWR